MNNNRTYIQAEISQLSKGTPRYTLIGISELQVDDHSKL